EAAEGETGVDIGLADVAGGALAGLTRGAFARGDAADGAVGLHHRAGLLRGAGGVVEQDAVVDLDTDGDEGRRRFGRDVPRGHRARSAVGVALSSVDAAAAVRSADAGRDATEAGRAFGRVEAGHVLGGLAHRRAGALDRA